MQTHIDPIQAIGRGLNRPECVLAHKSGLLFTSNCSENGGISVISPDGTSTHLVRPTTQNPLKPNGIALEPNGRFLVAHLGPTDGGIFRIHPNGQIDPVVTHANGIKLPPTNFITVDAQGQLWIAVSTTLSPRDRDYRRNANTGFIAVAEPGQSNARIVADKLGYTNEFVIDDKNSFVYVNETFGRRLTRFDLEDDGSLSNRHQLVSFPAGTYPDGLALDAAGHLWLTSIVSNRVIKISPDGIVEIILEDSDEAHLAKTEAAYKSDNLCSKHLASTGQTQLKNISSLAFGGKDLTTAYLGNLLDSQLYYFETGVQGHALPHWDVPLGALEKYLT